jgi:hypothetical protein
VLAGRSAYRDLAPGQHCFEVRAVRAGLAGPAARRCWTVTELAPGCVATHRQGYFVKARSIPLAGRRVELRVTTRTQSRQLVLETRVGRGSLSRVAYQLDGRTIAQRARHVLRYDELARDREHTLVAVVTIDGRTARIVRRFRYVNYVSIACEGRRVVGALRARSVTIAGGTARIVPHVPRTIRGAAKLRFTIATSRRHMLRAVGFRFGGRELRQHLRSVAFSAPQLSRNGSQTLTVRLVPRDGAARTVAITFRTRAT